MGPILDLAQVAHIQPASVEYISDLILHIFVIEYLNSFYKTAEEDVKCVERFGTKLGQFPADF